MYTLGSGVQTFVPGDMPENVCETFVKAKMRKQQQCAPMLEWINELQWINEYIYIYSFPSPTPIVSLVSVFQIGV